MPFIVDDILLTYIVLPYGKRLLSKGQDQLFNWLDSLPGEGAAWLKATMSGRNNEFDALTDLGHYVTEHRGTANTLATAAYADASGVKDNIEFLTVVRDYFLTPAVEMVKELKHPAVVPGFLTGTDWLLPSTCAPYRPANRWRIWMSYSARTSLPKSCTLRRSSSGSNATCMKKRITGCLGSGLWQRMTNCRKLGTTPGELAATLDELACDEGTTAGGSADMMKDQRFVTAITRQRVVVRHADMMFGISPPSTTGDSERIPWATDSAGIQAMREGLERQLGDQKDEQDRWIKALMGWASGSPAPGVTDRVEQAGRPLLV